MISSIIGLLLSLLSLSIITYYVLSFSKRTNISWDLKNGMRCCNCKKEIEYVDDKLFSDIKDKFTNCKECERDNSLNLLFGRRWEVTKVRIRRFLVDDRWVRWQGIYILSAGILSIVGIILQIFIDKKYNVSDYINVFNSIFWSFMIFRMRITTIPKEKTRP